MIIVSKDKKIITNFDNVLAIQIDEHIKNTDGEKDYEIVAITEEKMANIGVYETEERAKEVLEEIVDTYKFNRCYAVGQKQAVYEMPEE